MSRFLLQLRDALALSYTKFKIRRVRTVLTLITTSVMVLILVVASSVLTGFMNAANSTSQAQLRDLNLAVVDGGPSSSTTVDGNRAPLPPLDVAGDVARFRAATNPQNLRDVYVSVEKGDGYLRSTLDLLEAQKPPSPEPGEALRSTDSAYAEMSNGSSVVAQSTDMLRPFAAKGQTFNSAPGEPLPILVPLSAINEVHSAELRTLKTGEQRVAKRTQYQNAILGKTGNLTVRASGYSSVMRDAQGNRTTQRPPVQSTVLPVRVVGFVSGASFLSDSGSDDAFVLPLEAIAGRPDLSSAFNKTEDIYPSFTSSEARNKFVAADKDNRAAHADPVESNKEYFDPLGKVFRIAVVVMLVLMAIPMAATISKLLADSQRETGVFRAIGARTRNIVSIYGLYSLQMVVGSFLLALVLGELICAWLTHAYAGRVELAAADYASTTLNVSFVQFNVAHLGLVFLGLIAGAVIGIFVPLLRALRRDPIKALRDE